MSTEKKLNPDKTTIIEHLTEKVNASPFVLVIDYTGVTVPEFTELRAALSDAGATCMVAKNTFMAKAIAKAGLPDISASLKGQTAYVMGEKDVCAAAKAINTFAKKSKKTAYKVGILDGAELTPEKISALGELPSREVLIAKLLGSMNAPISGLVSVLGGTVRKLLYALNAVADAKNETAA